MLIQSHEFPLMIKLWVQEDDEKEDSKATSRSGRVRKASKLATEAAKLEVVVFVHVHELV